METGPYGIYTGNPDEAYHQLFIAPDPISSEIILARIFSEDLLVVHNVNYYTVSPTYGKPGLEKRFINCYQMRTGSRFHDLPASATMQFSQNVKKTDNATCSESVGQSV